MNRTDNMTTKHTPQTQDVLTEHGLRLLQPKDGYRFSADALLLARFADIPAGGRVIDLGCGCGIENRGSGLHF